MKKFVVIVAGGKGSRLGVEIPKQFMLLANKPILMHSIQAFYNYDNSINIILVLPENKFNHWKSLCRKYNFSIKHKLVAGGNKRFYSVKNGLAAVEKNNLVAIHDGVRPLVKTETIDRCFESAEKNGNAVPAVKPVYSMRKISGKTNTYINRDNLRIIQTPQVYYSEKIIKAYNQEYSEIFTDEANVAESYGEKIHLVEGDPENIKITLAVDLVYANLLLEEEFKR